MGAHQQQPEGAGWRGGAQVGRSQPSQPSQIVAEHQRRADVVLNWLAFAALHAAAAWVSAVASTWKSSIIRETCARLVACCKQRLCAPPGCSPSGRYRVKLWILDGWRSVTVDDRIPVELFGKRHLHAS